MFNGAWELRAHSPDIRHKVKASLRTILAVTHQFLAENLFLVEQTKNDQRDKQRKGRQGPIRSKG